MTRRQKTCRKKSPKTGLLCSETTPHHHLYHIARGMKGQILEKWLILPPKEP
jgi:hypothetical protein